MHVAYQAQRVRGEHRSSRLWKVRWPRGAQTVAVSLMGKRISAHMAIESAVKRETKDPARTALCDFWVSTLEGDVPVDSGQPLCVQDARYFLVPGTIAELMKNPSIRWGSDELATRVKE